jgi:hypothetical protein
MLATTASAFSPADHWALNANSTMQMPWARWKAKSHHVMPAVRSILSAGNAVQQGAVLRAVMGHPSMAHARQIADIDLLKKIAAAKFVVGQSTRMMEWNCSTTKLRGNSTAEKRNAAEVLMTFSASLPEKTAAVPSQRQCAPVLGMPASLLK